MEEKNRKRKGGVEMSRDREGRGGSGGRKIGRGMHEERRGEGL